MTTNKAELPDDETPKYSCEELLEQIKISNHDVKKFVSVAHGYISLMRLDIEEDTLSEETFSNYLNEMETMLMKSYGVMDELQDMSLHVVCKDDE